MTGSTISSTSAAITALPPNTEPPGPKPSRPGPRSPAWPLWHSRQCAQPKPRASSRPQPHKLTVPLQQVMMIVPVYCDIQKAEDIAEKGGRKGDECAQIRPVRRLQLE